MRFFKGLFNKVEQIFVSRRKVDEEFFEELEESMIAADIGMATTMKLVEDLKYGAKKDRITDSEEIKERLKAAIRDILLRDGATVGLREDGEAPLVYLFVGVNGVGKTTTIAKLAARYKKQGKKVIMAAADTFRAAAIDQLEIWADRVGVDIVKHRPGADPAAVVFDAVSAAKARGAHVVLADTAGRLHNKTNLMEELRKIGRTVVKANGRDADELILVLDATTGQNAVNQARDFSEAVPLTGISLSKMDSTAKGGIIVTVKDELNVPVKLVTVGEKVDDLEEFDARVFVDGLFAE
ncbi:MAG: signal recognition particle-docking protein FtsY [Abditibacteriota bacterium]|nr:signal recognition particle-docking protein FtsY [Abditibacteriota bacterium]